MPDKRVEGLLEILREVEYVEWEDADDGLQIWCPICGGSPEREKLPRRIREGYPSMGGRGHHENCKLARALYGP